jgi:hypothetical protein
MLNSNQGDISFFIVTLSRPINLIGLVSFALCSLGPLCTISLQQLETAGSLFLFVT